MSFEEQLEKQFIFHYFHSINSEKLQQFCIEMDELTLREKNMQNVIFLMSSCLGPRLIMSQNGLYCQDEVIGITPLSCYSRVNDKISSRLLLSLMCSLTFALGFQTFAVVCLTNNVMSDTFLFTSILFYENRSCFTYLIAFCLGNYR